ncbi:sugar O-acetyltransferase [Chitinilyticum litopenaei]|uniref:sugar O-acetyltransferase n=1 Tax=Chitinilyticum litopenaei TaxID=1121276 RepID=UPI0011861C33|nr:sugar O-acetyltransferase [Chitinilyticum litopenaei]
MRDETTIRYAFADLGKNHAEHAREHALLERYNALDGDCWGPEARALLDELLAENGGATIMTPAWIGRGSNVRIGRKAFINAGVVLDGAAMITIGHHTLIGPGVRLLTAFHPVDPSERQRWAFWARPITIGENVWIGADALILAGVTIGDHSVIGAGSVVTRDVPRCTLVAGNPAQVIRQLDEPDPATLYELNP